MREGSSLTGSAADGISMRGCPSGVVDDGTHSPISLLAVEPSGTVATIDDKTFPPSVTSKANRRWSLSLPRGSGPRQRAGWHLPSAAAGGTAARADASVPHVYSFALKPEEHHDDEESHGRGLP